MGSLRFTGATHHLPRALLTGCLLVTVLYVLANVAYLNVLPAGQIAEISENRVAERVATVLFGKIGSTLVIVAILASTFGCVNGLILAGARVYYAMALDGLFFRRAAQLGARHHAPVFALVIQGLWAMLLTLTGSYSDLLDYVIFAVLLFYILTIAGIFVLRRTRPRMERPYRAFGYPFLPAVYIAAAGLIEVLLLVYKPNFTWPGLVIVLLGVPVYFIWRRKAVTV